MIGGPNGAPRPRMSGGQRFALQLVVAVVLISGGCGWLYVYVRANRAPQVQQAPPSISTASATLAATATPAPSATPEPTATPDPRLAQARAELDMAESERQAAALRAEIAALELDAANAHVAQAERFAGATATANALYAEAGALSRRNDADLAHYQQMLDVTATLAAGTAQAVSVAAERNLAAWRAEQNAAVFRAAAWVGGIASALVLALFAVRWIASVTKRPAQAEPPPASAEIPINDWQDQRRMARATEYIERWLADGNDLDDLVQADVEQYGFGYTGGAAHRKVAALLDGMRNLE